MNYEDFRREISHKVEEKPEWRELATFVPNKKLPVHGWFYYKEGFAAELVHKLIEMFNLQPGSVVLDPFCGSGTTLVACKHHDIRAVGYDVMPISVFASRVKTQDYDADRLKDALKKLEKARFRPLSAKYPHIINRAFSKYALQDIAFLRSEVMNIDPDLREFFVLALISAALKCSYAYKDGSFIKFRKHSVAPLRKMLARTAARMIKDMEKSPKTNSDIKVEMGDARAINLESGSVDAIITSPPYLNNIDYTRVYEIEEFFIMGEAMPGVRAYIGMKSKESDFLAELNLPVQARLYFEDMYQVLQEMHRILKKGGRAAIVVGNGYVDEIIESDMILSYLAQRAGLSVEKIYVLNTRFALENRTVKKGILRESLIILKK